MITHAPEVFAVVNPITFAVTAVTLALIHSPADHWGQRHTWACTKGQQDNAGRVACLKHVAAYTGYCYAALVAVLVLTGLYAQVNLFALAAGLVVNAGTHYWADRRETLKRLAERTGRLAFYTLGAPREGHDDNVTLGTGAYALDQSWHHGWIWAAAVVTAIGSA